MDSCQDNRLLTAAAAATVCHWFTSEQARMNVPKLGVVTLMMSESTVITQPVKHSLLYICATDVVGWLVQEMINFMPFSLCGHH